MTEIIRYLFVGFGVGFTLACLVSIYITDKIFNPKRKGR